MKGDSTLCESPYTNIALDEDTSYLDEISAPNAPTKELKGRKAQEGSAPPPPPLTRDFIFIQGLSANLATARSPRGHLTPIK